MMLRLNRTARPAAAPSLEWSGVRPTSAPPGCVFVIPFINKGASPHRERGLLTVAEYLRQCGARTVIVSQGACPVKAGGPIQVVEVANDQEFSKSRLINIGIEHCLKRLRRWEWMLQLDADILFPLEALCADMLSIPADCNVVVPWRHWVRLTKAETSLVRDFPNHERELRHVVASRIKGSIGTGGLMLRRKILKEGFRWNESYLNWGWEDTDAADRAVKWKGSKAAPHRGSAVGVHLWHENDRVIQLENGEKFFGGPVAPAHRSGVLLEAKTKFLLVAPGRCGGNLLGRSLNEHPEVFCNSAEPFIHATFQPPVGRVAEELKEWTMLRALCDDKPVVGLRTQYDMKSTSFAFTVEDYVRWAVGKDFRVIHLVRRDYTANAISHVLARATHNWIGQLYPTEPVTVAPAEFSGYYRGIRSLQAEWIPKLEAAGALLVYYEDLVQNWDDTIAGILDHLGVKPMQLPQAIERQTTKPHIDYVENKQEILDLISQLESETP
jgi:LPS sulfotransferase NodH